MNNSEHISQELWERFERYLDHSMDESERLEFESQLSSNPDLRAQLDEAEQLISGIETAVLQSKLNEFHEDITPVRPITPPEKRKNRTWMWSVAAVLVATIGLFWIFDTGSETEKLFAKHFTPDPGLPTTMGENPNYNFYDGMVNYKQGDYKSALQKWEELDEHSIGLDTLNYFKGVAYLAEGNTEKSIGFLQSLWDSEENSFQSETAYYLGMAYLKNRNIEDAIKYLTFSKTAEAEIILLEIKD